MQEWEIPGILTDVNFGGSIPPILRDIVILSQLYQECNHCFVW